MKRKKFIAIVSTVAILVSLLTTNIYAAKAMYETPTDFLTPVKDQWKTGTCWAHAVMGAIEISLKKATGIEADLSEAHIAYNLLKNSKLAGATIAAATDYLMRLDGPVFENAYPRIKDSVPENPEKEYGAYIIPNHKNMEDSGKMKHDFAVGNVLMTNLDGVKANIEKYGAVAAAYYDNTEDGHTGNLGSNGGYYGFGAKANALTRHDKFFNNPDLVYHYAPNIRAGEWMEPPNHAVTLVGWDDDKIIVNQRGESSRGAFKVRQSRGKDFGNKGYMWISYATFPEYRMQAVRVEDGVGLEAEKNVFYAYDNFMTKDPTKKLYTFSQGGFERAPLSKQTKLDLINVYDKAKPLGEKEIINNIQFVNEIGKGLKYTAEIVMLSDYDNLSNSQREEILEKAIADNKFIKVAEGVSDERGLNTIKVKNPLEITNNKFAIRLILENENGVYTTVAQEVTLGNHSMFISNAYTPYSNFSYINGQWGVSSYINDLLINVVTTSKDSFEDKLVIEAPYSINDEENTDENKSAELLSIEKREDYLYVDKNARTDEVIRKLIDKKNALRFTYSIDGQISTKEMTIEDYKLYGNYFVPVIKNLDSALSNDFIGLDEVVKEKAKNAIKEKLDYGQVGFYAYLNDNYNNKYYELSLENSKDDSNSSEVLSSTANSNMEGYYEGPQKMGEHLIIDEHTLALKLSKDYGFSHSLSTNELEKLQIIVNGNLVSPKEAKIEDNMLYVTVNEYLYGASVTAQLKDKLFSFIY